MGQLRNDDGTFGGWDGKGRTRATAGAVVLAGAMAFGAGGGATTAAGGADAAGSLSSRVGQAKNAARKGDRPQAWRRLGVREVKDAAESAVECAAHSYGRVREFFLRNPCRSLDRTLITLADERGGTFVVSVSWVRMRARGDVGELKSLIDTDGTGSVKCIGFDALRIQGIRFTGEPFQSDARGDRLVVAEAAVVSGKPGRELMEAAVLVAAELAR